ncbi:cupin domain-containing protein [Agromyces aerolatus]|uniref:cupin domain-containing protein n=1 Tax=Agromyces sp. LY-1074 TaxID=3074080 RepID=UPI0028614F96|nr:MULTISPECIES: cupin domain-containing protein [unclassified Agromyces]MDR5699664.1 cupin domain-containing protein [Agromyces sp. LY-1074]MDR5705960.1 cupin domain-containing protein [Agromyces sp. LY-1358]
MPSAANPIVAPESIRLGSGRSRRFQGRDHGADISYFYVDAAPGEGPALHRHPYSETWVVLEGEATFTIGEAEVIGSAGDTATVGTGVWHAFKATGAERLRILCIHASDMIIQEFADEL